ncbi:MAG: beta-galactosidase [Clostridia bacterium]|nr:beta-galactosidase [Clostridia bacterium]
MAELKLPFIGHGGDYNPDQWLDRPDILEEDIRLMKLAGCNLMSVGIFAWAALEPREGEYDFDWLERVLDRLHENGISVFLATPSGARPAWMSQKYPEVLRVREDGQRNFHGGRHNHCYTSPVYRRFVSGINRALAERFGHHPAVVGWHISNELGGECHCELCQQAFREALKARYGTLEALNKAWWTGFWSKTYTDWSQLRSPSRVGESCIHGLTLAWRRFVTERTIDFLRVEVAPLRKLTPDLPVTTNMMEMFEGLDYEQLAKELDFTSMDSYPRWGGPDEEWTALCAAFNYDWMRSLKQKPFALMESTPSQVNWHDVCKLKKPGMHVLASLQAVAHGADTVQYFQWRKSRGAAEKFHGAVVDHAGHEHTRTFRDVQAVGELLRRIDGARGAMPQARVALVYDTQNRWALSDCQGPLRDLKYLDTVLEHYRALKRLGLAVDIVDQTRALSGYQLVAAPMLYMLRPGAAERLTRFVAEGGTLVCSCFTGRVDEDDLCFLGGFPGPLRALLGLWVEETDALYPDERNGIRMADGRRYACSTMCDLIHPETAETLGSYTDDFYAGESCVTVNSFEAGKAYYIATRPEADFLDDFYARLVHNAGIARPVAQLPRGVQAAVRGDMLFVMNFNGEEVRMELPEGTDILTGLTAGGRTGLPPLGYRVLRLGEKR